MPHTQSMLTPYVNDPRDEQDQAPDVCPCGEDSIDGVVCPVCHRMASEDRIDDLYTLLTRRYLRGMSTSLPTAVVNCAVYGGTHKAARSNAKVGVHGRKSMRPGGNI
jgi:hypothetical protein